jgi:hypothetical protein
VRLSLRRRLLTLLGLTVLSTLIATGMIGFVPPVHPWRWTMLASGVAIMSGGAYLLLVERRRRTGGHGHS